jgi:hypothetical protein
VQVGVDLLGEQITYFLMLGLLLLVVRQDFRLHPFLLPIAFVR